MPPDRLLLLRGGDRIPHEDEVLDLIDAAAAAGRRYSRCAGSPPCTGSGPVPFTPEG
jgi:hypothetical protein